VLSKVAHDSLNPVRSTTLVPPGVSTVTDFTILRSPLIQSFNGTKFKVLIARWRKVSYYHKLLLESFCHLANKKQTQVFVNNNYWQTSDLTDNVYNYRILDGTLIFTELIENYLNVQLNTAHLYVAILQSSGLSTNKLLPAQYSHHTLVNRQANW